MLALDSEVEQNRFVFVMSQDKVNQFLSNYAREFKTDYFVIENKYYKANVFYSVTETFPKETTQLEGIYWDLPKDTHAFARMKKEFEQLEVDWKMVGSTFMTEEQVEMPEVDFCENFSDLWQQLNNHVWPSHQRVDVKDQKKDAVPDLDKEMEDLDSLMAEAKKIRELSNQVSDQERRNLAANFLQKFLQQTGIENDLDEEEEEEVF